MRTTVVPAQITSVEDKIAGNLSFSQLLLLIAPLFLSVAIYVVLPPFGGFHIYKVVIASIFTIVCLLLAIRIRGRLIAEWIALRARYNARPLHYVFNKNSSYARKPVTTAEKKVKEIVEQADEEPAMKQLLFLAKDQLQFDAATTNPSADFHFKVSKKGGLSVRIKKV